MSTTNERGHLWWIPLGLTILATLALTGWLQGKRATRPAVDLLTNDADLERLLAHLEPLQLQLRVVSTAAGGKVKCNAFLTRTDHDWEGLNCLVQIPERIEEWRGTVYCEWGVHVARRSKEFFERGNCCLQFGPFYFFGDPNLLKQIRTALHPPQPD
jgi:hypothetical protein